MEIAQIAKPDPWYAARVRSNQEQVVVAILSAKGYEAYAPTYRERRQWSDRVKELERPLFPGYVFCRMDPEIRLPVLTTPGIVQIVGAGKMPVAIDEDEIASIQKLVASGVSRQPCSYPGVGDMVKICGGPLSGVTGILEEVKSSRRLVVSISLLQRSVAVELQDDCVVLHTGSAVWRGNGFERNAQPGAAS